MATILKGFNDLKSLGFTEADLENANNRVNERAFFVQGTPYGGANDPRHGKWVAKLVATLIFKDPSTKKWTKVSEDECKALATANGGKLEPGKQYTLTRNGNTVAVLLDGKNVSWQVVYTVDGTDKDSISKSFLFADYVFDCNQNVVSLKSDIRDWAVDNIVNGTLDREWTANLANILNTRSLRFELVEYPMLTKEKKPWQAKALVPYFAE